MLSLKLPPNPGNPPVPTHPKLRPLSRSLILHPAEILHRIIRLHPDYQITLVIQNVNTLPRARHNIAVQCNLQAVGNPVLRKVDGPPVADAELAARIVDVVPVYGASARRVEARCAHGEGGVVRTVRRGHRARIRDVKALEIRGPCNAVRLLCEVVDERHRACGGAEAVRRRRELRRRVGERVEPAVHGVREPHVAVFVDADVVDRVEVVTEIVVQNGHGFVGRRIEGADAGALFATANAVVTTGGR